MPPAPVFRSTQRPNRSRRSFNAATTMPITNAGARRPAYCNGRRCASRFTNVSTGRSPFTIRSIACGIVSAGSDAVVGAGYGPGIAITVAVGGAAVGAGGGCCAAAGAPATHSATRKATKTHIIVAGWRWKGGKTVSPSHLPPSPSHVSRSGVAAPPSHLQPATAPWQRVIPAPAGSRARRAPHAPLRQWRSACARHRPSSHRQPRTAPAATWHSACPQ